jgi:hypothetical protein
MNKEKLIEIGKKISHYGVVLVLVISSFYVGRKSIDYPPKQAENPYSHAFSPQEVSIAVNESNELLLIEKKTGKYMVYSDAIGMNIFKMYAGRIYSETKSK